MEALIGHLPRTHTQLYSDLNTTNDNLSNGLYGITQDTTLDQLMKHMSDWNHPFVFDISYALPIAPDKNNAVGIGERGMLHAFSYSGKHFYCIDASKGWQESPYALKSDLTKSIDFRGNAKTFKVRSGTDGLKNIYLDIEDESGNSCSLAFLSDGENAVKLMLNNKVVWTK